MAEDTEVMRRKNAQIANFKDDLMAHDTQTTQLADRVTAEMEERTAGTWEVIQR